MRKLGAVVLTLVAALAVGGIAADAAKKQKVKSKITLKFNAGPPGTPPYYEEATFSGKVTPKAKGSGKAKKKANKKCKRGRTVVIKQVGGGKFGQDKTNKKGRYQLSAAGTYDATGRYKATVKKKKKGKIICKAKTSKAVMVF